MNLSLRRRRIVAGVAVAGVVTLLLVFGAGLRGTGEQAAARFALRGEPAPALAGQTLSGERFRLADLEATAVVVNVWASWCGPCREELPMLAEVRRSWADRGVRVVTVDTRDGPSAARSLLEEVGATELLTVLDPDGRIAVAWGAMGVPETFVVDGDGTVRARHVGEVSREWLRDQLNMVVSR